MTDKTKKTRAQLEAMARRQINATDTMKSKNQSTTSRENKPKRRSRPCR